jgi:hypothetical protein
MMITERLVVGVTEFGKFSFRDYVRIANAEAGVYDEFSSTPQKPYDSDDQIEPTLM